ncbi:MAG: hypothetical protein COX77_04960 [Candidatus Komeilibacteria bacterium CG_4_10_14_0_2_um_filter_37_10]|uniref:Uncharacterized protein n=1 Tax=Candidatus Komeilibacteria bacterium CG_4_10_14_0_2_um_filter_37_10 TaxID=1974470 RepID=A0A2M7VD24_9BACT|nr:MAG: hypothetical protein COX77_04960 [Candidatus Komeilibacteria bacterium CG_4_10_14_0_2_um_filter_37_10]
MINFEKKPENLKKEIFLENILENIQCTPGIEYSNEKLSEINNLGYQFNVEDIYNKIKNTPKNKAPYDDRYENNEMGEILGKGFEYIKNEEIDPLRYQEFADYILNSNFLDYSKSIGSGKVGWEDKYKACKGPSRGSLYTSAIYKIEEAVITNHSTLKLDPEKLSKKVEQDFIDVVALPDQSSQEIITHITSFAEKHGISLPFDPNNLDSKLLYAVHSPFAGHVNRDGFKKNIPNFDEVYGSVIKKEFRDVLNIPKGKWLDKQEKLKICPDGKDVAVEIHGFERNIPGVIEGKFILGKDSDNGLIFAFDGSMGEHMDIQAKYNISEVFGGGWLIIKNDAKKIILRDASEKFGQEPRIISATIIKKEFPEYEVFAGTGN